MTEVLDRHAEAMDLAEEAVLSRRRGRNGQAKRLFKRALELEASAARQAAQNSDRSAAVLYQSAAAIALDCDQVEAAQRLIRGGLETDAPEDLKAALRALERRASERLDETPITQPPRGMNYPIVEIEGIAAANAKKLAKAGVTNTNSLLKAGATPKGRKALSRASGVSENLILKWCNLADLMRVSGIGKQYSELLEASGIDTVKELRNRNAAHTAAKMKEINAKKKLTRTTPSASLVDRWIEVTKSLGAIKT